MVKTKHTLMISVEEEDAKFFKSVQSDFKTKGISASYVFKQFVDAYKKQQGEK